MKKYFIELTVADHEANGFVSLARWQVGSITAARAILNEIDTAIPPEAEGNMKVDPYNFILDLRDDDNDLLDTNKRCLPLQLAMRLAPARVEWWLSCRPDPELMISKPPVLPGLPSLSD